MPLANPELTEVESVRMQRNLHAVLDYAAQLNKLDTSAGAAMAQVSDVLKSGGEDAAIDYA